MYNKAIGDVSYALTSIPLILVPIAVPPRVAGALEAWVRLAGDKNNLEISGQASVNIEIQLRYVNHNGYICTYVPYSLILPRQPSFVSHFQPKVSGSSDVRHSKF